MKKISKILTLVLALCMVLALAACGSSAAPAATTAPAADGDAAADTGAAGSAIDWPKKNVTIIVATARWRHDLAARAPPTLCPNKLGANFVVNNLAGGSGVVGRTELLANDGDGHPSCLTSRVPPITQVLIGQHHLSLTRPAHRGSSVFPPAPLWVKKDNALGIQQHGRPRHLCSGPTRQAHLCHPQPFTSLTLPR